MGYFDFTTRLQTSASLLPDHASATPALVLPFATRIVATISDSTLKGIDHLLQAVEPG
jgi:hypothetical protein